jgi:hypothetical protein
MRKDILCLDSALMLTRGNPVGLMAAISQLHPDRGSYTGVASGDNGDPSLLGQMTYSSGNRSARLAFVAPARAAASPLLVALLEGLAWQAGEWGAFHLLGEVDELSPAFEPLRRAGFSVYAWQRIWRLDATPGKENDNHKQMWQPVTSMDEIAVRSLYQNLVPPLVQSAEPLPNRRLRGLAFRHNNEIMAYVEWVQGPRGLFLHPVVHPDLTEYGELLRSLVHSLPLLGRPAYLAVRSYQSFLENALADLSATATPRHALLVKHLTTLQRVPLGARLGVEARSSEVPTASMVNHFGKSE